MCYNDGMKRMRNGKPDGEDKHEVKAYVSVATHRALMVLAAQRDVPVSDVIRVACQAWLNKDARIDALLRDYVPGKIAP